MADTNVILNATAGSRVYNLCATDSTLKKDYHRKAILDTSYARFITDTVPTLTGDYILVKDVEHSGDSYAYLYVIPLESLDENGDSYYFVISIAKTNIEAISYGGNFGWIPTRIEQVFNGGRLSATEPLISDEQYYDYVHRGAYMDGYLHLPAWGLPRQATEVVYEELTNTEKACVDILIDGDAAKGYMELMRAHVNILNAPFEYSASEENPSLTNYGKDSAKFVELVSETHVSYYNRYQSVKNSLYEALHYASSFLNEETLKLVKTEDDASVALATLIGPKYYRILGSYRWDDRQKKDFIDYVVKVCDEYTLRNFGVCFSYIFQKI